MDKMKQEELKTEKTVELTTIGSDRPCINESICEEQASLEIELFKPSPFWKRKKH